MSKKLAALLCLVLVLVAVCAFACAETQADLSLAANRGRAIVSRVAKKTIDTEAKYTVDLYPTRGSTVSLWYWNDGTGGYNMKTGNEVDSIYFSYYGTLGVQVISGGSWLAAYKTSYRWFDWDMNTNYSTASRKGKIRVYDSRGTVMYLEIRQCCDMDIVSVKQLDGWNHSGEMRVQSTKASGTHGKVYYNAASYYEYDYSWEVEDDMTPRKFIRGKIWFHPRREIGTWQYYYLRPYRVMGGQNRQGPRTGIVYNYVWH